MIGFTLVKKWLSRTYETFACLDLMTCFSEILCRSTAADLLIARVIVVRLNLAL